MVINYPNGKTYTPRKNTSENRSKKDYSFSNRGKTLEDEINETNDYYMQQGTAVIHKKPVPIQVVKVEYPSRSAAVIKEAYYRTASTTDFNGVWQGIHVDFEAKETKNKTSFPLKNIHAHQIGHMRLVAQQKGLTFLIVRFSLINRYFVLPFAPLLDAWEEMGKGGRKSIPFDIFEQNAYEIVPGAYPPIDYLKGVINMISEESGKQ
ncbi:Holliday junction resolvase RecU [Paenisporosarcina sp. OV554]|uniref:Holliday junction resolvase RecU n=1 Tax=Paenisporosarcina sp. OV554 TaxID=2135694 RepID=UPI000D331D26|nr:Holliday junction resolvase RecU [Paenisporosarcina sp. OV554]PUB10295.1 recombination protein U [Paenisporosarcina sp. OV554]